MGGGNDTLTVIDGGSPTDYTLHGGDGDDTIKVEGNVKVSIFGDDGDDTIDGGDGSENDFTSFINGGPGTDHISFGGGDFANVNLVNQNEAPVFELVRTDDDTSIDDVTFDNSHSRVEHAIRVHSDNRLFLSQPASDRLLLRGH